MAIATADFWKSINAAWDASTLDALFRAVKSITASHIVLHDQDASPGQDYPYCVVNQFSSSTVSRMSGGVDSLREVRDAQVTFNVHAKEVSGDSRSAKQIAAYLAEEIMKVFGGHPTVTATASMELDNGNVLLSEYQTDYGIFIPDDEFNWIVSYRFEVDVPVMA